METQVTSTRQRVWVTTAAACTALGMSCETLPRLLLRGVLSPGKHYKALVLHPGSGATAAVAPGKRGSHKPDVKGVSNSWPGIAEDVS